MRQAGRCLADYRKLRERYSILTLAKTPDLCAEVTVMPVEAFGVDAAVLFADIMLPLEPMGVSLEIQPEVGPIIHAPVRSRADVDGLRVIDPDEEVRFVMEAIRLVRRELDGEQAVIGYSGAPFTRQPLDAAWERIGSDSRHPGQPGRHARAWSMQCAESASFAVDARAGWRVVPI